MTGIFIWLVKNEEKNSHLFKDGRGEGWGQGEDGAAAPDQADPDPEGGVRVPRGERGYDRSVPLKGHR